MLVSQAAGSRLPRRTHRGGEDLVVIAGRVRIGGVDLEAGDYLCTDAGEDHHAVALSDAVLFVSSQKPTPLVERGARLAAGALRCYGPSLRTIPPLARSRERIAHLCPAESDRSPAARRHSSVVRGARAPTA